jgi:DNA polymerase-4
MPAGGATILHADLDAFYASVEQLLDPSLRGQPIAVGGGVVLAASYEAKAFGVQGGMAGWRAKQLCPGLRFVGGHFREYQRLADDVMAVLDDITPVVERISIDEAFVDVSGSTHLFGPPVTIAALIRRRVRDEIGLPISIGAARTKHLAKVASQVAKPDGVVIVEPGTERAFLDPLPVGLVWGVGPVTRQRLAERGITTIGQLAATPSAAVRALLGEAAGAKLHDLASDRDRRKVRPGVRAASVGAQSALGRTIATDALLHEVLGHLVDRVATRLRAKDRAARTITVRVRFGMRSVTRSMTLSEPVSATLTMTEIAVELAGAALADHPDDREISLLGVSASNLEHEPAVQLELPVLDDDPRHAGSATATTRAAVDRSMDAVRRKFGRDALGYTSTQLSSRTGVPDDFRELAERDG